MVAGEAGLLQANQVALPEKLLCLSNGHLKSGQYRQFLLEMHIMGPLLLMVLTWPFRVKGVGGLVRNRVHTSAYTAHRVAIVEKLWFTGQSRSKMSFHNVNSLRDWVTVLSAGLKRQV